MRNREEKGKKSFERGMERKKKLRCPAESEKLGRKEKEELRTGHGEGKEAEMPRRG